MRKAWTCQISSRESNCSKEGMLVPLRPLVTVLRNVVGHQARTVEDGQVAVVDRVRIAFEDVRGGEISRAWPEQEHHREKQRDADNEPTDRE